VGAQAVVNRLITVEGGDEMVADEINEDRVVTGRGSASAAAAGSTRAST
jgi:GTP pyrophosphokinase